MNQAFNFDDWILYQDDYLIAINKPSGLLSVPGKRPEHKFCAITQLNKTHPEALIVHRLDMDTSGLLLLARDKDTHRALSILFQERKVDKTYVALCQGKLLKPEGRICLPMRCDWDNRPKQIIDFIHGRSAQTDWQLITQYDDYFSVKLHPITGRSHQLRLHMKSLGHPILGDNLYADNQTKNAKNRLMLHAEIIEFNHPKTGEHLKIECPNSFFVD